MDSLIAERDRELRYRRSIIVFQDCFQLSAIFMVSKVSPLTLKQTPKRKWYSLAATNGYVNTQEAHCHHDNLTT